MKSFLISIGIIFLLLYLYEITVSFLKGLKIGKCLCALSDLLNSFSYRNPSSFIDKKDDFNEKYHHVLQLYPDIESFGNFYSPTLSYGNSEVENLRNSVKLYNELLMTRNYVLRDFKKSFNPLQAIKRLLALPSSVLRQLGFSPKSTTAKIINLLSWIAAYLLGLYSDEIKSGINFLITNLPELLSRIGK